MTSSRILLVGVLGIGCLAASGVGGYLAVRSGGVGAAGASAPAVTAPTNEQHGVQSLDNASAPEPTDTLPAAPEPERTAERKAPTRTSPSRAITAPATSAPDPVRVAVPELEPEVASEAPTPSLPAAPMAERPTFADMPVTTLPDAAPPATETIVVARDAVIGIRMETAVSSETAAVEDRVVARVTRDVRVDDFTAIPAGARLEGTVTLVERGGRFKERARIGVRFTSVILDGSARVPIETEAIFRDGESPTGEATSKIGASAVVGTILGAVIGGKKGAAIGGTAGAAGGTAVVMTGDRNEATIPEGTTLTVRLSAPLRVTITPAP